MKLKRCTDLKQSIKEIIAVNDPKRKGIIIIFEDAKGMKKHGRKSIRETNSIRS